IKFSGHNVRTTLPNSANKFYWWEDFVNLTNEANKKTYKDFNTKIIRKSVPKIRKVERPSRKDLHILIWSKPTTEIAKDYNLSDKTIQKWVDDYKLIKPARGYWAKVKFGKIIHSVPEYKE
ncbi:MAG: hypothetical protein LC122_13745, partial [Chitinophagales bacterium]|nr:hypothetical protein [Chitinophagales bacterium]